MNEKLIHQGWVIIAAGILSIVSYFGSRVMLESFALPSSGKLAVALLPAIPFGAFLWLFVKNIGQLDEMQRRIQLEAMAFAFPLTTFLLMALGLLQLAVDLPAERFNYRDVWMFLPVFYFSGLALAWRRYK